MSIKFLVFLYILLIPNAYAKICNQLKVAVVDTGLDLTDPRFQKHLCPIGHKNFIKNESIEDLDGHGSHVTGLIQQFANNANYCLLIYKYYSNNSLGSEKIKNEVDAFKEAISNGAKVINFSSGGPERNESEYKIIKDNPQVTFVVAAGNDGKNLDDYQNRYYPACYWLPNLVVVAGLGRDNKLSPNSNYSNKITEFRNSVDVLSYLPNNKIGPMSGTSMSAAQFSGELVDKLSKECHN